MYNFEEIKEVIMPYLESMYGLSFIMHPYSPDNEKLYSKDDVLIIAHNALDDRFIECLGLTEDHEKTISDTAYKIHKEIMDDEFKRLEENYKDDTPDVYDSMTEEECKQFMAEMEALQAAEAAEQEEIERYWANVDPYDISGDYHAMYECLRSSLIRHTEELMTLVGHTIDTMVCELHISTYEAEKIMSVLTNKIKETTNL